MFAWMLVLCVAQSRVYPTFYPAAAEKDFPPTPFRRNWGSVDLIVANVCALFTQSFPCRMNDHLYIVSGVQWFEKLKHLVGGGVHNLKANRRLKLEGLEEQESL